MCLRAATTYRCNRSSFPLIPVAWPRIYGRNYMPILDIWVFRCWFSSSWRSHKLVEHISSSKSSSAVIKAGLILSIIQLTVYIQRKELMGAFISAKARDPRGAPCLCQRLGTPHAHLPAPSACIGWAAHPLSALNCDRFHAFSGAREGSIHCRANCSHRLFKRVPRRSCALSSHWGSMRDRSARARSASWR